MFILEKQVREVGGGEIHSLWQGTICNIRISIVELIQKFSIILTPKFDFHRWYGTVLGFESQKRKKKKSITVLAGTLS